jgi:hypothetical protein
VGDLGGFNLISPCGFSPEVMTRLADWVPAQSEASHALARWNDGGRTWLEASIARRLAPVDAASHILKLRGVDLGAVASSQPGAGYGPFRMQRGEFSP